MSVLERVGVDPAAVEREAVRASPETLASFLQEHLGQQMTAYLAGLKDQKMVGKWASGKVQPRDQSLWRMQYAYQAARLMVGAYGDSTARSWFFGTNSVLDGEAPAWVLRHGDTPEDWRDVVPAAKHFIVGGYA